MKRHSRARRLRKSTHLAAGNWNVGGQACAVEGENPDGRTDVVEENIVLHRPEATA